MLKKITITIVFLLAIYLVYHIASDNSYDPGQVTIGNCGSSTKSSIKKGKGLLASRLNSFEELKSVVDIQYSTSNFWSDYSKVELRHCSLRKEVSSILESGLDQSEIMKVRGGGIFDKASFLLKAPFAVANRMDLIKVYNLIRRKPMTFSEGDVAFYDFAERSVENINTKELAFIHPRDSSEKGYINSFNHITAQAFITSCFSEELANFIADVHERKNMPELTTGKFTEKQMTDKDNFHIDNYVDMINNEWGQEIGKELKTKYNISQATYWTPELTANYLNDLQRLYSQLYQIGFKPYSSDDQIVIKFAKKINIVMQGSLNM